MSISEEDIIKVANLANIEVDKDVAKYTEDLSKILGFINEMNNINTDNVEPMYHPYDNVQRLRDDVVTEENKRDKIQAIAPNTEEGLYLVPKVLD